MTPLHISGHMPIAFDNSFDGDRNVLSNGDKTTIKLMAHLIKSFRLMLNDKFNNDLELKFMVKIYIDYASNVVNEITWRSY